MSGRQHVTLQWLHKFFLNIATSFCCLRVVAARHIHTGIGLPESPRAVRVSVPTGKGLSATVLGYCKFSQLTLQATSSYLPASEILLCDVDSIFALYMCTRLLLCPKRDLKVPSLLHTKPTANPQLASLYHSVTHNNSSGVCPGVR